MPANYYTRYLRHAHIIKSPRQRTGTPRRSRPARQAQRVREAGALPAYLRLWWLCASPLGLAFAARITWEKLILVHTGGPDLVDFSLSQLYPTFGIIGILCCYSLMVWLLQALSYLVARWRLICLADVVMVGSTFFVAAIAVAPERFLA